MARETREQDGLPRWVKTAAAVIGLVATFATILTGIGAIIMQYRSTMVELEKERTHQKIALKEAAEYRLQQAKEKVEADGIVRQGRESEQAQALVLKREEAKLAELQIMEKEEIIKAQERERDAQEEQDFLLRVSRVADSSTPVLGDLVAVKRAVRLHPEYDDLVANALVARAEKSNSLSEIRLIFGILSSMRVREVRDEVSELRQLALERYKEMLQGVFLVHLVRYSDGRVSRETVCKALQLFPQRTKNSDLGPSTQRAIVVDSLVLSDELTELDGEIQNVTDVLFDEDRVAEGEQAYLDQISLNGLIISSARSFLPASSEHIETQEKLDELERFCGTPLGMS
jgi:hypothetical protein